MLSKVELFEQNCIGKYTKLAGEYKNLRLKQKIDSSEFDLVGLHCIYIYVNNMVDAKSVQNLSAIFR